MNSVVVGIDGCRYGWCAIANIDNRYKAGVFPSLETLTIAFPKADIYMIDMPMGLGDKYVERTLDIKLKKLLYPRHSTVFYTPCREAIEFDDYPEANQINKQVTGKGLSIQSWNIAPKIRELDIFLRSNRNWKHRFYESSPELCFAGFNMGKPLLTSKSTKEGFRERIKILSSHKLYSDEPIDFLLKKYRRSEVGIDDIMDAYILCMAGYNGRTSGYSLLENDNHPSDSLGIPMRIFIYSET